MSNLVVAALFLIGTHVGIASSQIRTALIHRLGEPAYLVLYSLLAVVAIGWLVVAWRAAPLVPLWRVGLGLRDVPLVLMPIALLLVVCALSGPNPTAVGQNPDPDARDPATGILRVTRHPLMWGVGLWALAHILVNGDQASVIFFGTFAVLALGGAALIDLKRAQRGGPGWGVFLQATSNVPLVAIAQHRQRFVPREIGLARVAAALGLYVLLLWAHPYLFGVSPLP
jgi:uncharacterized membrane protein